MGQVGAELRAARSTETFCQYIKRREMYPKRYIYLTLTNNVLNGNDITRQEEKM